jgi:hypothetical protein
MAYAKLQYYGVTYIFPDLLARLFRTTQCNDYNNITLKLYNG